MVVESETVEWNRTALVCSLLANASRDPDKRREPFGPLDFHPYQVDAPRPRVSGTPITGESIRQQVQSALAKQGKRI